MLIFILVGIDWWVDVEVDAGKYIVNADVDVSVVEVSNP